MAAQSQSIPTARGPLTEQQLSSGCPGRAWNAVESLGLAMRVPPIGVLYVTHRPQGDIMPRPELSIESSSSSATTELPVILNMSTDMAIHATVQHVSIAP